MVIYIVNVRKGKTPYHLEFDVYNGELNRNRKYYIEYTGTELIHNMCLTDEIEEALKESLNEDFGFAPFDIDKAKRIIGKSKTYVYR